MNVDPDGKLSRKLQYSLSAGLAFLISELLGGISFNLITGAISATYVAYKNYISKHRLRSYSEIVFDMKYNGNKIKKMIKKEAREVALKIGLKALIPLSFLSMGWYFGKGMYYGYNNYYKYKKYSKIEFAKIIESKYN